MNEHELEQLARTLGERAAARLDIETTARTVSARLREQPAKWVAPEWLRIAAAVVLLAGAGLTLQRVSAPAPASVTYALEDLNDLTASELAQILATLDRTLAGEAPDEGELHFEGLTPAQLQSLLRSLET